MPDVDYLRKYTKKTRKVRARRAAAPPRISSWNSPRVGLPNRQMVRHRYAEELNYNAGLASFTSNEFAANDLFDPNVSGVGHQPQGFDQWGNFYDHFTVLYSKITIQVLPEATGGTIPSVVGIMLSDATGILPKYANFNHMMESPELKAKVIVAGGNNDGQGSRREVSASFSADTFFGKTNAQMIGTTPWRGSLISAPAENALWTVFQHSVNGNNPDNLTILATIDYWAVWTEPRFLGQSS